MPKRGGTLQAALTGGSSSDTLNALDCYNSVDFARIAQLYDPLVAFNASGEPTLVLAEEIAPNHDATSWTIRLRHGVTFHNGKPLTADDLLFTFQQIVSKKSPMPGAPLISRVNVPQMRRLDSRTVRVDCLAPFATFAETLACYYFYVVPEGYDSSKPNGTGAFKFRSWSPGVQSDFIRNENYWQSGLPYLDEVIISDYADQTSQLNALIAGQADVANLLDATAIPQLQASGRANVLISLTSQITPFTMRTDLDPFRDVRVRQALRLLVNRPQMLEVVFGGHGRIGNDVFSFADPAYDHSLPQRAQDIEQAKFLLKKAGHEKLALTLATSDIAQGTVKAAEAFAQQASAAGVSVSLQKYTVTQYFGPNYLKWPFAQDYMYYAPYLAQVSLTNLPTSPFNECHFNDSEYTSLDAQALGSVQTSARYPIDHEMMKIDYETGGMIIPYFPPVIDGYGSAVHGLSTSITGQPLNDYNFKEVWKD